MYNERQKVWQRENRQMMVKCHLCRDCGRQDARTLNGYSYCYECGEKRREYARVWREKHRDEVNARRQERRAQRKDDGLCTHCGRKSDGRVLCARCRAKDAQRFQRSYEHKRVGNVCFQCCKGEPLPGKKLCRECYEKNMVTLRKMWERRGIHVERKQG